MKQFQPLGSWNMKVLLCGSLLRQESQWPFFSRLAKLISRWICSGSWTALFINCVSIIYGSFFISFRHILRSWIRLAIWQIKNSTTICLISHLRLNPEEQKSLWKLWVWYKFTMWYHVYLLCLFTTLFTIYPIPEHGMLLGIGHGLSFSNTLGNKLTLSCVLFISLQNTG